MNSLIAFFDAITDFWNSLPIETQEDITNILTIVLVVGIPILIIILIVVANNKARKKRSFCEECNTKIEYENDVAWQCTSTFSRTSGSQTTEYARVKIVTTCPNCGHQKIFKKEYMIATFDANTGRSHDYDLDDAVRRSFLK